jgi:hypothetical protein
MNVLEERRPILRTLCWENREETAYHTWLSVINSGEGKTYDDQKTAGRLRRSCNSKEYSLKAYVYTHHIDDDAKKNIAGAENLKYIWWQVDSCSKCDKILRNLWNMDTYHRHHTVHGCSLHWTHDFIIFNYFKLFMRIVEWLHCDCFGLRKTLNF